MFSRSTLGCGYCKSQFVGKGFSSFFPPNYDPSTNIITATVDNDTYTIEHTKFNRYNEVESHDIIVVEKYETDEVVEEPMPTDDDINNNDDLIIALSRLIASNIDVKRWLIRLNTDCNNESCVCVDVERLSIYASLKEEQEGVFMLNLKSFNSQFGYNTYDVYSDQQGFVKFDLTDNSARDPFNTYTDINLDLYNDVVASFVG